jgi:S1-C subfamily serine protease
MIHLSTKLQPGYSGGPLLDASGRLVGVVAMMSGPQVGLAVPVHVIKAFLRQALAISSQTRRMALGRHCVSTAGRAAASPAGVRGDRAVFSPGDAT